MGRRITISLEVLLVAFFTIVVMLPARTANSQAGAGGSDGVQYFDHQTAEATAWKRSPLFPMGSGNYSVITAKRKEPGLVEIHTRDTDVMYIIEGSATFVTGGKALNAKSTVPNEIRGTGMEGGTVRQVSKGDVIIVPHGVPHWFKVVPSQVYYFIVKVR